MLADCLGSLLVYDILTSPSHSMYSSSSSPVSSIASLSPKTSEHRYPEVASLNESPCKGRLKTSKASRSNSSEDGRLSPLQRSTAIEEASFGDGKFENESFSFDVSHVFVLGSPLGMVLASRKNKGGNISKPACSSFYNLFYSVDSLASRLEPLLDPHFSTLHPVTIPPYQQYPTGEPLVATISIHENWDVR